MDVDNNANKESVIKEKPKDAIDNNSDLLAILEGKSICIFLKFISIGIAFGVVILWYLSVEFIE